MFLKQANRLALQSQKILRFNTPPISPFCLPSPIFSFSSETEKQIHSTQLNNKQETNEKREINGEDFIKFFYCENIPQSYIYRTKTIYSIDSSFCNLKKKMNLLDYIPMPCWLLTTIFTIKYVDVWMGIIPFTYCISSISNPTSIKT